MKPLPIYFFVLILLSIACRTSDQPAPEEPSMENLPNLVEAEQPDSSLEVKDQPVHIDQAEWVDREGTPFILIRGNLPNPCCHLNEVNQTVSGNEINLSLTAWQPANAMCSQVLKPFSYLHPIPEEIDTDAPVTVILNDTEIFELHQK